jgi:hypothetical protein
MKKLFLTSLCFSFVFFVSLISFASNDVKVQLYGKNINFPDAKPYIESGRTLVPVRFIAEELGYEVKWNAPERKVSILKNEKEIELIIDSKSVRSNFGTHNYTLDVPARITNGRTMVPLRFVSEVFENKVSWDANTRTAVIEVKNGNGEVVERITTTISENDRLIQEQTISNEEYERLRQEAIDKMRQEQARRQEEEREKREEERLAQIKPMVVSGFSFEGRAVGDNGTSFETADRIRIDLDGVNDPREVKVAYSYIQTGNNGEMTESQKQNFEKILRSRFGSDNAVSEIMKLIRTPGTHTATQQWSFYTSSGTHLRLSGAYRSVFVDVFR